MSFKKHREQEIGNREGGVSSIRSGWYAASGAAPKRKGPVNLVQSCDWPIEQLPGLSQQEVSQLQNCGISTTKALIEQSQTLEAKVKLANKLQIHLQYVNKWVALADLARIPSVGTQYCGLLLHAGVASVALLATIPTHRLHKQILRLQVATMQRRDLCPSVEQVQQWVQEAQAIRG
jgi:hypothetical protein